MSECKEEKKVSEILWLNDSLKFGYRFIVAQKNWDNAWPFLSG